MKITLKKLSHNNRLSEETYCFSAIVCIDGKPVFEAANRGHGGCHEYHPINGDREGMEKAKELLDAHAAAIPAEMFHGMEMKHDADWVISDLVTAALEEKEKAKLGKKMQTVIHMVEGAELFTLKLRPGQFVTHETIASAAKKYPTAKVLNGMPLDEAWAIARSMLGFS